MSTFYSQYTDWQSVIKEANRDFEAGDLTNARIKYLRAIDISSAFIEQKQYTKCSIGAYLVSYHNLADLYARCHLLDLAYQTLLDALQTLVVISDEVHFDEVVVWGQQLAQRQVYLFQKQYGEVKGQPEATFLTQKTNDSSVTSRPHH